jgi:Family of unknown function (DUF5686)
MVPIRSLFLTGIFCFILYSAEALAGSRIVHGFSKDAATGVPVPFPKIIVEGGAEWMGDMEGNFTISVQEGPVKVTVVAYQYLEADVYLVAEDSVKAYLYFAHPFTFQTITTGPAKRIIKSLLKIRSQADPRSERNLQYQSYNKILITTQYFSALKIYLDNLIRLFSPVRLNSFSTDHHIFLMESASERMFQSRFRQKERVVASRISGINKPPALSLVSGFEPLSVYEPFLRIGSKRYISPLAGRPGKRYVFYMTDSIRMDSQTIYVIKFNPKSLRNKELLQGFIYVARSPLGVIGFQVWPAFDKESTYSLLQKCDLLPSGRWFPSEIKTTYQTNRLGALRIPITASSKTYLFNLQKLDKPDSVRFDEVIFEFQKDDLNKETSFPARLRQERLSQRDKNTYQYYESVGSLKGVDRYLTFGQKLAAGRIPFGRVDVVFRKAITVNDREGLRLGLGLQSTELWSEKHQGGGYFAKGLKDKQWKFGLNYRYFLNDRNSYFVQWKNDLAEPGIFQFGFNNLQYPTEQLRLIRISRFDVVHVAEMGWDAHWLPNVFTRFSFEGGRRNYSYNYQFVPDSTATGFDVAEIKADFHWSPGEQFARFGHEKFSLRSDFPAFWFQIAQGCKSISKDAYTYTRLEAKMQWTRKILGLGEIGIQCVAGWQNGQVPYPLLFSNRASYRDFSLLSYNSFETMRYNEFLQDRYVSVFFSHTFSKMQVSTLPYRPYFSLIHNMGWGRLGHPENHRFIKVQDMPNGYFESGLFLNDLFVIPLTGLNLGIGAGIFVRYGPYALSGYLDNVAFKFSTNLGF